MVRFCLKKIWKFKFCLHTIIVTGLGARISEMFISVHSKLHKILKMKKLKYKLLFE